MTISFFMVITIFFFFFFCEPRLTHGYEPAVDFGISDHLNLNLLIAILRILFLLDF